MADEAFVADTSWLYSLLDDADEHHRKAVAEAEAAKEIHVPHATMVETVGLIRHRVRSLPAAKRQRTADATVRLAIDRLASRSNIRLGSPPYDHEAAMRVWDSNPRLGYVDACVVAAAQAKAMDIFSFDQAQRKALGRGKR